MDTLNLLNNYEQNRITKEALLHHGVTEEEISKLIELGAIKSTQINSIYVINLGVVQTLITQYVIGNDKLISREKLIHNGVSDGTIRKMIKEGMLFTVSRGRYSVREQAVEIPEKSEPVEEKTEANIEKKEQAQASVVSISEDVISNTTHLSISNDIMKKIEEGDLASILDMIEKTNGEEFISLSKQLWKWVFTNIFQNNQVKTTPVLTKQEEVVKEKPVLESKKEPVEEKEDIQVVKAEKKPSPIIEKKEEKTPKRTGLSLKELWNLYYSNKNSNPVVAKEFLKEIRDVSIEFGILFDYKELSIIDEYICGMNISREQRNEEKSIRYELNNLFKQSNKTPSMVEKIEELVSKFLELYQARGVVGNAYKANLEALKGNYNEAISLYMSVLEKQPWNFIANKELCYLFSSMKNYSGSVRFAKNMLKYYPNYVPGRKILAKYYIETYSIQKLKELSNFEITDENKKYAISYFENVISMIQSKLDGLEKFSGMASEVTKKNRDNYNELTEELASYVEIYAQLSDCSDIEEDMLQGESRLALYEAEVYYATMNGEDNSIHPSKLEGHISNLEITSEDEMLLYIAAAKICFVNKMPKYGDYYLKKVSREKEKTDIVKEEYNQCVKNKKLYLNQ